MSIDVLAGKAINKVVGEVMKTKAAGGAIEEMTSATWQWMRPLFLKDDEPLKELFEAPDLAVNQAEVKAKVMKCLSKDEAKLQELNNLLGLGPDHARGNQVTLKKVKIKSKKNVVISGGDVSRK